MRIAVVFAVLALAPTLAAADDDDAEELAERGFAAYDDGEYASAITYFKRAYDADPTAGLLYNIAQAYRKLGDSGCEPALEYYQRYRDALEESGAEIEEGLRARIVEMQECGDDKEGAEDDDDPERAELFVGSPPPSGRRRVGWGLVIGGAALVATSGVTGVLAVDRESSLSADCRDNVCPPALEGRVRSYDRLRYTAFATGAAGLGALAVGTYLIVSSKRPEAAPRVAVQPVIGRATIGVRCAF